MKYDAVTPSSASGRNVLPGPVYVPRVADAGVVAVAVVVVSRRRVRQATTQTIILKKISVLRYLNASLSIMYSLQNSTNTK